MPHYEDYLGGIVERPVRATIEWRVSCYAIAIRGNHLLMVQPAWAQRWELPGGGVELDLEETLLEAAARECREETGYAFTPDASSLALLSDGFFSISSSRRFFHSLMFTVVGSANEQRAAAWQQDPREIVDVQWLDLRDLDTIPVHPPHLAALVSRGLVISAANSGR